MLIIHFVSLLLYPRDCLIHVVSGFTDKSHPNSEQCTTTDRETLTLTSSLCTRSPQLDDVSHACLERVGVHA